MPQYCLALDLIDDPVLIAEYEAWHIRIWPEVVASIHESGIETMEIFRVENRLFMIMQTNSDFSFTEKEIADRSNVKVQEWEALMWQYQQAIPGTKPGEKWRQMDKIFELRKPK